MQSFARLMVPMAALTFLAGQAEAQEWHHVHLATTDRVEAAAWYVKYMEGEPGVGVAGAVFGNTNLNIWERDVRAEGSVGSSLDHIGFSFPDLAAKLAEFEEAGITILSPMREVLNTKIAFIEDPWGTKIEVLQDLDRLGFHHIHLLMDEPVEAQAWFAEMFGGEATDFLGAITAVDYGDYWLMLSPNRGGEPLAPTLGRSVDHIGWIVDDLDATAAEMRAKGAEFHEDPHWINDRVKISYLTGPGGVNIEVLMVGTRQ